MNRLVLKFHVHGQKLARIKPSANALAPALPRALVIHGLCPFLTESDLLALASTGRWAVSILLDDRVWRHRVPGDLGPVHSADFGRVHQTRVRDTAQDESLAGPEDEQMLALSQRNAQVVR